MSKYIIMWKDILPSYAVGVDIKKSENKNRLVLWNKAVKNAFPYADDPHGEKTYWRVSHVHDLRNRVSHMDSVLNIDILDITEPKAHFEKYGYKCPQLALYHEKFTDLVNNYLNAFTYFDHKLYDTVHTAPSEEEMDFLNKVQHYQNLLHSYKRKRKLKATDSLILQHTFDNLEYRYYVLEDTATASIEAEAEETESIEGTDNTPLEAARYPILEKSTDSQIITIFDSKGRVCLWDYHPSQKEHKEPA